MKALLIASALFLSCAHSPEPAAAQYVTPKCTRTQTIDLETGEHCTSISGCPGIHDADVCESALDWMFNEAIRQRQMCMPMHCIEAE